MSEANQDGRWGAGKDQTGVPDATTVLIWKTIAAHRGITRDELFARIEHEIPDGWAIRALASRRESLRRSNARRRGEDAAAQPPASSPPSTASAREYVFGNRLNRMTRARSIACDGDAFRTLRDLKPPKFDPDHVDETGTKAAQQLDTASAWRTVRAAQRRMRTTGSTRMTRTECDAFLAVQLPGSAV